MHRFRRLAILLALGLIAAACSGGARPEFDDASGATDSEEQSFQPELGEAPTPTPFAECEVEVVERDATWPFAVDSAVAPTEYLIDDLQYVVRGITNDPEGVLVNTMEGAFPDFNVGEPDGGSTDVRVDFTSDLGTARLLMADDDGDDCWDVELSADYIATPSESADAGGATGDGSGTDETGADDPIDIDPNADSDSATDPGDNDDNNDPIDSVDPLDEVVRVGVGQIITAQGTFQLAITACSFDPIAIEAVARNGELRVGPSAEDGRVAVTWTYTDGVEVADDVARVLDLSAQTGSFVADGENEDGPESLIIELTC